MNELDDVYFEWLLTCLNPDGVTEGVAYLCGLLHDVAFLRRVGRDINRASDGANLRKEFFSEFDPENFDEEDVEFLLAQECSWLEMLIALCRSLDFIYEGGVDGRFLELIGNMRLGPLTKFNPNRSRTTKIYDRRLVEIATGDVDNNRFDRYGRNGLFPLKKKNHPDQREVEIWDQHAAYFREKLEGVLWTSTD